MQTPANSETGPDGTEGGPVRAMDGAPATSQHITLVVDRPADHVAVLHVTGEIDLLTANTLGERIREQLQQENGVLVLDLTAVTFLGSAGLAEIVSASQAGADRGARLLLVATNRAVLRPLEVTGLLSLFTVYDSVDAALADLR